MSNIRVTYTGLISLITGLISLVIGLIVILIITRGLTPEEFGTWRLIINLIVYVNFILPIVTYWVTREVARGIESGKTAILSSGLFSCIGISLYLIIIYSLGDQLDADREILLSAFVLIPMIFLNNVLVAINYGWRPHAISYGAILVETIKIPLLLIAIYWFEMGVLGVIYAVTLSYIPSIILLLIFGKEKIKDEIRISYIKKWFKFSWLPSYPSIGSILAASDVVIFSIITGSVLGLTFYGTAVIISKFCSNASSISTAVYPKLLEGKEIGSIIENNVLLLSFVAIPLATISIFFAKPGAYAINPLYVDVYPAIIFMTFRTLLFTFTVPFAQFLTGSEKVDTNENASFKDYVKSKLFTVFSIRVIQYSLYLISLTIVLLIFSSSSTDIELVVYWSIIWLVIEIPFSIYFYILIKKNFKFQFKIKPTIKYIFASIITIGFSYFLSLEFLEFNPSLMHFAPNLILFIALGIFGYLVLTYFIDDKTKKLFNSIISEIKPKNNN
tara:strand:+ start:1371 stop:2873 length:1503 start_codon:yes stop_codon:yes gene_type:complete